MALPPTLSVQEVLDWNIVILLNIDRSILEHVMQLGRTIAHIPDLALAVEEVTNQAEWDLTSDRELWHDRQYYRAEAALKEESSPASFDGQPRWLSPAAPWRQRSSCSS